MLTDVSSNCAIRSAYHAQTSERVRRKISDVMGERSDQGTATRVRPVHQNAVLVAAKEN